jgi:hypothetical protein
MFLMIIVTFAAGNAFGPAVNTVVLPNETACQAARKAASAIILDGQLANAPGARLEFDGVRTLVVQRSGRVSAAIECVAL